MVSGRDMGKAWVERVKLRERREEKRLLGDGHSGAGKKIRKDLREKEKSLRNGGFRLGILNFLKKSRAILHSKELNINQSSLRAKLGALKVSTTSKPFSF